MIIFMVCRLGVVKVMLLWLPLRTESWCGGQGSMGSWGLGMRRIGEGVRLIAHTHTHTHTQTHTHTHTHTYT